MKKLAALFLGFFLSLTTFAQSGVVFNDAGATYNKKTTTSFHFGFDSNFTEDKLNETATYYTNYFKTTVTAKTEGEGFNVTIELNEDSEMARRVIMRYFVSLEVAEIKAGETTYSTEDFMIQFIQL